MTYSVGGTIQASDFNAFVSTNATNLNKLWAAGSTNWGYGQTAIATVTAGNKVFATGEWAALIAAIIKAADHQGSALSAWVNSTPTSGQVIQYEANLGTNLTTVETNRLNAAAQGATSTSTATTAATWSDTATITFTINFGSDNAARWFFNAGGQIGIQTTHPAGAGTTINQLIDDICTDAGTVWLSSATAGTVSLAGTSYNGVTKVGGANPAGETISTNTGFYALAAAYTQLFKQLGTLVYHAYETASFLEYNGAYDGAGSLSIQVVLDEIPNGAVVSSGTAATITVRPPSTTYLTNSWGTPTITNTIVLV